MGRWVEFTTEALDNLPVRGYEGAAYPGPIDKAAEMVLCSTENRILAVTVHFSDSDNKWTVVQTSEQFWADLAI